MPKRPPTKMPISHRAKIFAPFAALKGYEDALAQKEKEKSSLPKKMLSPDREEELNGTLQHLKCAEWAVITYYRRERDTSFGEYITLCGRIHKIDFAKHFLILSDMVIFFDDIVDIQNTEDV